MTGSGLQSIAPVHPEDRGGHRLPRERRSTRGKKKQDFVARSGSGAGGKKSARFCCAIYREP